MRTDSEYMRRAYIVAANLSTDPSTQNGAILVDSNGEIMVAEANHFPDKVVETPGRWERPAKYSYVEHAERNVLYFAAKHGVATAGLTMYCPWAACDKCARAIIQCGIREVVCHYDPQADTRFGFPASPKWLESIKISMEMLNEAGVSVRWIDDVIFPNKEISIRFNEQMVYP